MLLLYAINSIVFGKIFFIILLVLIVLYIVLVNFSSNFYPGIMEPWNKFYFLLLFTGD